MKAPVKAPAAKEEHSSLADLKRAALEAEPDEVLESAAPARENVINVPPADDIPVKSSEPEEAVDAVNEFAEADDGWTTTVSAAEPEPAPAPEPEKPPVREEAPAKPAEHKPVHKQSGIPETPSGSYHRNDGELSESSRAGHYDKNNEIAFDISNGKASSGPPVSEAERQRRAAALDALDRDLNIARSKRLEELEAMRRMEAEKQRQERERLERARLKRQRLEEAEKKAMSAEQLKEKTESSSGGGISRKTEGGAVSHGTSKVRENAARKDYNGNLFSMNAVKVILAIFILLALLYAGAYVYSNRKTEAVYDDLTTRLTAFNRIVTDESIPYAPPENAKMTLDQKKAFSLDHTLPDTDMDGLEDKQEIDMGTDPLREDSDGDTLSDGLEYRAGLDPLEMRTDGTTLDSQVVVNTTVTGDKVSVELKEISIAAQISLVPAQNYTLNGTPGMVGTAFEFTCSSSSPDAVITFVIDEENAAAKKLSTEALSVFVYDPDETKFTQIDSEYSQDRKSVSAKITSSGVYALFDTNVANVSGKTQVFFLFDNSGSMYPEELCKGSEENDVDFKRLDMALNLIDMLGDSVNYGAGEFSGLGSYKNISPISGDTEQVKQKIDDIRNKIPPFTGTMIADALDHALVEFGDISRSDKNYIVLLTDGQPTKMEPEKDKKVISEARADNITIFTIGLGKDINAEYLINIAQSTNGQFFQATNADALENIYDKIKNYMSYNQIVIDDEKGTKGFVVGDSGFNVAKNGFGYNNFRAEFAPHGADVGLAGIIKDYYSTGLPESGKSYTTKDGLTIQGYDISGIKAFSDGKINFNEVHVDILDKYEEYLCITDKWDFRSVSGGLLRYNDRTRKFIEDAGLRIVTADYDFEAPQLSQIDQILCTITNTSVKAFTQYECVLIDSTRCTDDDLQVMRMINWYCNLPYAEGRNVRIYDFGYQGDKAIEELNKELTEGIPSLIAFGGNALNAIRLSRDNANSNIYVLEAYDSNSPERVVKIRLTRSPLFSWDDSQYQYIAERNGEVQPLRIIVT